MLVHVPIRLPSLANARLSWRRVATLKKKQREAVATCLIGVAVPVPPLTITITRVGPKHMDDDNLASACKYVRDAIAAKIGVDDGSPLYTWLYQQRIGQYGVDVEITRRS